MSKALEVTSYTHPPEPSAQLPDATPANPGGRRERWRERECFYVSVRDGKRHGLLAGPYAHHRHALDAVEAAREAAQEADPFAFWYSYGTCRVLTGAALGRLNDKIGYIPPLEAPEEP